MQTKFVFCCCCFYSFLGVPGCLHALNATNQNLSIHKTRIFMPKSAAAGCEAIEIKLNCYHHKRYPPIAVTTIICGPCYFSKIYTITRTGSVITKSTLIFQVSVNSFCDRALLNVLLANRLIFIYAHLNRAGNNSIPGQVDRKPIQILSFFLTFMLAATLRLHVLYALLFLKDSDRCLPVCLFQ